VVKFFSACLTECAAAYGDILRIAQLFLGWQVNDDERFPIQPAIALITDQPRVILLGGCNKGITADVIDPVGHSFGALVD